MNTPPLQLKPAEPAAPGYHFFEVGDLPLLACSIGELDELRRAFTNHAAYAGVRTKAGLEDGWAMLLEGPTETLRIGSPREPSYFKLENFSHADAGAFGLELSVYLNRPEFREDVQAYRAEQSAKAIKEAEAEHALAAEAERIAADEPDIEAARRHWDTVGAVPVVDAPLVDGDDPEEPSASFGASGRIFIHPEPEPEDVTEPAGSSWNVLEATVPVRRAVEAVSGPRDETYGDPAEMCDRIARIWSGVLKIDVEPYEVSLCLLGMKLAREAEHHQDDNLVDIHGYGIVLDHVTRATRGDA